MSRFQDVTTPTAARLKGDQHHEPVKGRYKPMRGQAYVKLDERRSSIIEMPDEKPDQQTIHRGVVLALGPPARLEDKSGSPHVPWSFHVGDTVYFHLAVWLDRMRILEFLGVEGRVAVVAQGEIVAVAVPSEETTKPELPRDEEDCDG